MKTVQSILHAVGLFVLALSGTNTVYADSMERGCGIVIPGDASYMERLAAKEVRRYLYLRTGRIIADRAHG